MKRKRRKSSVELMPLPESAAIRTRCSGRRLLALDQRVQHPQPARRRPGLDEGAGARTGTPSPCGSRRRTRSGRRRPSRSMPSGRGGGPEPPAGPARPCAGPSPASLAEARPEDRPRARSSRQARARTSGSSGGVGASPRPCRPAGPAADDLGLEPQRAIGTGRRISNVIRATMPVLGPCADALAALDRAADQRRGRARRAGWRRPRARASARVRAKPSADCEESARRSSSEPMTPWPIMSGGVSCRRSVGAPCRPPEQFRSMPAL